MKNIQKRVFSCRTGALPVLFILISTPAQADIYPFSRPSLARTWVLKSGDQQDPWLLGANGAMLMSSSMNFSQFNRVSFSTSAFAAGLSTLLSPELALHLRGGLQYELGVAAPILTQESLAVTWDITAIADNYLLARPGAGAFSVLNLPPQIGWGADGRLTVAADLDGWLTGMTALAGWRSNRTVLGLEASARKSWAPFAWSIDASFQGSPTVVDLNLPIWAVGGPEFAMGTSVQVALLPRVGAWLAYQSQIQNTYDLPNQTFTAGLAFLMGELRKGQSATLLGDMVSPPMPSATPNSGESASDVREVVSSNKPVSGPVEAARPQSPANSLDEISVNRDLVATEETSEATPQSASGTESTVLPDVPLKGMVQLTLPPRTQATVTLLEAGPDGRFTPIRKVVSDGGPLTNFSDLSVGRYRVKIEEQSGNADMMPSLTTDTFMMAGGESRQLAPDLRWDGLAINQLAYPGGAEFTWVQPMMKGPWLYQVLAYRADKARRTVVVGRFPEQGTSDTHVNAAIKTSESDNQAIWGVVRFWRAGDRFGGPGAHGQSRPFRIWTMR